MSVALVKKQDASEEKILQEIERDSRCPFPGRQANRSLIDTEILSGLADPDEIRYEDENHRHFADDFHKKSHPELAVADGCTCGGDDIREATDFRDHIDHVKCSCKDGKNCQICVTSKDLMAIPAALILDSKRLPSAGRVDEFSIVMRIPDAIALGLITEEDLPEEILAE